MYHQSLSEPPQMVLRHEDVQFVSPLCDSHSKQVEKAIREEHSREGKRRLRLQPPRLAGLVGPRCSTIASWILRLLARG